MKMAYEIKKCRRTSNAISACGATWFAMLQPYPK